MSYDCKILADSISDAGHRLTTFEITFPRFVLAEFNTHRVLSRNSASSRAIPVAKSIKAVEEDPFIPESFLSNQPGMQGGDPLSEDETNYARHLWTGATDAALDYAMGLERVGLHKALANRLLEPFKWHTCIVTATDWSNFFALRTHKDAQPEIRKIALMMEDAYHESGGHLAVRWHLPLIDPKEVQYLLPNWNYWKKVSIGRCARVSYLTHHGVRDPDADIELHDRLLESRHLSPFEHVARPFNEREWALVREVQSSIDYPTIDDDRMQLAKYLTDRVEYQGNLRGWHSARMDIPNEGDYGAIHQAATS